VEPLLGEGSLYQFVGQEIGKILTDDDFEAMYASDGRSGINPVVLSLVTVFQFVEKLPDRAAAQMAVMRLDWKYALRQELGWKGFHYSDLCNFRKRLMQHDRENQVFEKVVAYLREQGYIKAGGPQRTDSTHILGAVRALSTIDLARETIRVALRALSSSDAPWTLRYLPASFVETYAPKQCFEWKRKEDLPQALQTAARDGAWLLAQVKQQGTPALQALSEVKLLRRVLNEQFAKSKENLTYTPTGPYRGNFIVTPYDVDCRRSVKRETHWIGYRCQVTETIATANQSRFITDVLLTAAPNPDNQHLTTIQQRLTKRQIPPDRQYVDQGYMSAANLAASQKANVKLRGRLLPDTAGKTPGFRLADFKVDIANQDVICPDGKHALRFVPSPP
jgi:transposase